MRSLPDIPPPFPPEHTPHRSDVAPRTSATPTDPPRAGFEGGDEAVEFPAGAFSPDDAIDAQIGDLERWAVANERREKLDSIRFWVLRGTAFLSAVGAGITSALGYGRAAVVFAGASALFLAIDSAWPGGSARAPYKRAVYDLRALQGTVRLRWDKVRLAYPNPTGAKRIAHALALLDAIQAKRDDIGKYLGSAEASPRAGAASNVTAAK